MKIREDAMKKTEFLQWVKFTICFLLISAALVGTSSVASRMVLASATSAENTVEPLTVIIDAGHGGIDGGAVGDDGTMEKELNLAVAKKLEAIFDAAGINVIMTRRDDVSLGESTSSHRKLDDLKARVTLTKQPGKVIFISIHMNKFPVEKYSGLQVYYSKNDGFSKVLAESIQSYSAEYIQPYNSRKAKAAGSEIYVLDNALCPAVLVECGFMSNRAELDNLKNENYQKQLAVCIFAAFINAVENKNTNV